MTTPICAIRWWSNCPLHDEFEASAVTPAPKGAHRAKANSPDLVLMDVGLPGHRWSRGRALLAQGGFKAPIII